MSDPSEKLEFPATIIEFLTLAHIVRIINTRFDRIEKALQKMSELDAQGFTDTQAAQADETQKLAAFAADSAQAATDLAADIAQLAATHTSIDFTSLIASAKANADAADAADTALKAVIATQSAARPAAPPAGTVGPLIGPGTVAPAANTK